LLGWGDVIGQYFDTNKIIVENHARPGRSSRTFQTQGWWANILAAAKPGDFVMIQMGHNDEGQLADTNRARGTLPDLGEESTNIYNPVLQKSETVHTYGWYMRKYITDARDKGMTPIICSPVPHVPKTTVTTNFVEAAPYVAWSEQVARDEKAFFINLNHLVLSHFIGQPPDEIRKKYFTTQDMTHFGPEGATLNAACVIEGLREIKACPLNAFLLELAD
jgi:lysophospholipase L1-like esterase